MQFIGLRILFPGCPDLKYFLEDVVKQFLLSFAYFLVVVRTYAFWLNWSILGQVIIGIRYLVMSQKVLSFLPKFNSGKTLWG